MHFIVLVFFCIFPELYRCCTVGDLPRVKELLEEASAVTINKLYQGGSTLLYKYIKHLILNSFLHVRNVFQVTKIF